MNRLVTNPRNRHKLRRWTLSAVLSCGLVAMCGQSPSVAQAPANRSETSGPKSEGAGPVYLSFAQFHIPFSIDRTGVIPSEVRLYVSTDSGRSWQHHGSAGPEASFFEFRAAAEGEYLFAVQTVDAAGVAFVSPNPPMRVAVDTTEPRVEVQAELDANGNLIVDLTASDQNLNLDSATLRVRTDRETEWREVPVQTLAPVGDSYHGQVELRLPLCREVAIVFSVLDHALNSGQASYRFAMPRTAGISDMQLASTRGNAAVADGRQAVIPDIPGAVRWEMDAAGSAGPQGNTWAQSGATRFPTKSLTTLPPSNPPKAESSPLDRLGARPGRLAASQADLDLIPNQSKPSSFEELPLPEPMQAQASSPAPHPGKQLEVKQQTQELTLGDSGSQSPQIDPPSAAETSDKMTTEQVVQRQGEHNTSDQGYQPVDAQHPFFCKARTFSLDYSVEAMGGTALAEVELWGTEDLGQNWQKWGVDPDRTSPFDVRVANDGKFGFRMVLVGQNGFVLGQPKSGEDADVWVHVDTQVPYCKISRAIYGEGSEAGMLVIDYQCTDADLADLPINLSYSTSPEGPWTALANNQKNSGLYLWKIPAELTSRIYLMVQAIDKAGNVGMHRLELPIDIKGATPRGRIQGLRPILSP
ncbi:MAG: hypothetical protein KF752_18560 [Pirellulaceae bacterium]|nr:hypothetical protein [Pirellulaceae bacterium]